MSTGITDATVEEIKARVDLADLISSYGIQIRVAGASKKACCPFHHEKTPSFNINETKGYYHCFGCGETGDAIKFVMKYEGLSFVEAVKKLADGCGVKIEEKDDPELGRRKRLYALLAELAEFYHRCLLKTKEAEIARAYVKERELGEQVLSDYLIGYAPSGIAPILKWAEKHGYTADELEAAGVIIAPKNASDRGYHRFSGRLMFSIRDKRGRVVGFSGRLLEERKNTGKYVNSPETIVFKKSNILYGFDKAAAAITRTANREAIVCEGQIDCIRLQTCGFANSVAGQGTAFTEEHVKMLKKAADQVVLVYDDDSAGHKATVKSARLCLAAELPVRVVSLPGGDDPDSFLRSHASDDFRVMVEGAQSIMSFQVKTERAKEKNPDSVDAVRRISREVLTTIAACPSAILRATMIDEAAKTLDLPRVALAEELEKIKSVPTAVKPVEVREPEYVEAEDGFDESIEGVEAPKALPPPPIEMAFLEFLFAHEEDDEGALITKMLGEFLPPFVFVHDFTRKFIDIWRTELDSGKDMIAPWSDTLEGEERVWFDSILLKHTRALESGLTPAQITQDFVRSLWVAHLTRVRGELPTTGDPQADIKRMKITLDLKHLNSVKWSSVKALIRDWMK